jgi:hypothetical protein
MAPKVTNQGKDRVGAAGVDAPAQPQTSATETAAPDATSDTRASGGPVKPPTAGDGSRMRAQLEQQLAAKKQMDQVKAAQKKLDELVGVPGKLLKGIQGEIDQALKAGDSQKIGEILRKTDGFTGFVNKHPEMLTVFEGLEKSSAAFGGCLDFAEAFMCFDRGDIADGLKALASSGGSFLKVLDEKSMKAIAGKIGGDPGSALKFVKSFIDVQKNLLSKPPDYAKAGKAGLELVESGFKSLPASARTAILKQLGTTIPDAAGPAAKAAKILLDNADKLGELYGNWDNKAKVLELIPDLAEKLGPEVVAALAESATGSPFLAEVAKQSTAALAGKINKAGKEHIKAEKDLRDATGVEANTAARADASARDLGQRLGLKGRDVEAFATLYREMGASQGQARTEAILRELKNATPPDLAGIKKVLSAYGQINAAASRGGGSMLWASHVRSTDWESAPKAHRDAWIKNGEASIAAARDLASQLPARSPEQRAAIALMHDQEDLLKELKARAE